MEAVFKLAIAFLVLYSPIGRLTIYAALLLASTLIINLVYRNFCISNFPFIRFRFNRDRTTIKSMLGFSLWSLVGNGSLMISNQGVSMLLNIFYSVIVNAALGIANQVNMVASTMISNFQTAFMPQITKSYAGGEKEYLNKLIFTTSRYSFLLLFVIAYPVFINSGTILKLWLGEFPEYTIGLVRVILLCMVFDALCGPLWMTVHATGNIRNYQIVVSGLLLLTLPTCYLAIISGLSPVLAYSTRLGILLILYIFRVCYVHFTMGLNTKDYLCKTLFPIFSLLIVSFVICQLFWLLDLNCYLRLVIDLLLSVILIVTIGLSRNERMTILTKIKQKLYGKFP